jgi:hypothetical protein
MKFFGPIDLQKNAIQNGVIVTLASAPSSPAVGQVYFDTALNRLQIRGNSAWGLTSLDSDLLQGQNGAYYLARANGTGTQLAATISDLATTVQAYRLDQFAVPTASLSLNSQKITNLADPIGPQDAATMNWVQTQVANAAAGIDAKASVRAVATSNITLSGTQTIDGVSVIAGDRVLVRGQTTASQNGVYVVAAGAWARAADADATGELTPGAFWFVEEGTTYGKTQWRIENTGTITIGSTSITINQFGASTSYTASLGVQLVGQDIRAQVVASGGISAVAGGLQIDTSIVARKYSTSVGNGSLTSIPVTHNLGTKDVSVTTRLNSTDEMILVDWVATDTNTVTLTFATAPAASAVRVTVIG